MIRKISRKFSQKIPKEFTKLKSLITAEESPRRQLVLLRYFCEVHAKKEFGSGKQELSSPEYIKEVIKWYNIANKHDKIENLIVSNYLL